jgi:hypothetical protein
MTQRNHEYYASRAAIERARAAACADPDVAIVHRELVRLYEQKVGAHAARIMQLVSA